MVERSLGARRNGKLLGELRIGLCTSRMECGNDKGINEIFLITSVNFEED